MVLATQTIKEYPGHFVGAPNNAAKVTETLELLYPGLIPRDLPSVTDEGRFYIPTLPTKPLTNSHPPFLIARFDRVVNKTVQQRLMNAWDTLLHSGVRFPPADENRSATPALHLGIWELYKKRPIVTGDTRIQTDDAIIAIDNFLYLIGELIAPKIKNLLKTKYPHQYERQMRCVS